jgi:PAS domain S-box-containing protein
LFEHSADAISLFDPQTGRFIESNQAVARLTGAPSKEALGNASPAEISPERQPDGRLSREKVEEMTQLALANGSHRFEWLSRRYDGSELPLDIVMTSVPCGKRPLLLVVARDISRHKQAEKEILELNASLEKRVAERTVELVQANEHLKSEIAERKRQVKVQRALFQISEAVHTVDDLNSLYARIHTIVKTLMPADNFYIALLNAAAGTVSFAYWANEFAEEPPEPRPASAGRTGEVLRTAKPLLVAGRSAGNGSPPGRSADADDGDMAFAAFHRPTAIWLGAPLLSQSGTFGVMAVGDYRRESAYGEDERQILAFVAEQTALAIARKRSETLLRESADKFRALFEASSQGVILHDEEKMLEVNPACLRILGFEHASEMIGKHPAETSAPIQPGGEPADVLARSHIQKCIRDGSTRFEWLAQNSRGEQVPIEVILTRIQWGGRQLIQAVFNDITDRKRAEAELHKMLAREKELGQLRSSFISMVSHEFRTPLGIIQSSAEILEDYLDQLEPEERKDHLGSIRNNTRRMAGLMEEALLIGRVDAGKMDFKPEPLDLRAFALRLVDEVLSVTNQRCPIELTLGELPAEAQLDERVLRHIFTNLLVNAVKYSEPGRRVRFEIGCDGTAIVSTIRDRGIGIPEADQEWLFSPFHRGRNVGARPGTGLGLVIVKRCVDLHGGKIKVESKPGEGTTVTVRLPKLDVKTQPAGSVTGDGPRL